VPVIVKPSFGQHGAVVVDFSGRGIGLFAPCRLEPGTRLAMLLRAASDPWAASVVVAEVRHATPRACDSWVLGCAFDRPLSHQEFCLLFQ